MCHINTTNHDNINLLKLKYKVTNWSEYTEALRCRGNVTLWFSDDAISNWHPEKIPSKLGLPQEYSDFAIECCLVLRQVYKLPLRQTQGFLDSLIQLMNLNINVPDYSNISKRSVSLKLQKLINTVDAGSHIIVDSTGLKVFGKDEWHQQKHTVKAGGHGVSFILVLMKIIISLPVN